ncbi:hypothetical protein EV2_006923 [Malus domestica]
MCRYGSKIQPHPHNHQFAYISGDTKILTVDRNIKLSISSPSSHPSATPLTTPIDPLQLLRSQLRFRLGLLMDPLRQLKSQPRRQTSISWGSRHRRTGDVIGGDSEADLGVAKDANHCWSQA